jgi:hypothetical protein
VVLRGLLLAGALLVPQRGPSAALQSLDRWVSLRYRGAHLMPDTASVLPSLVSTGTAPRIETIHAGGVSDTLWVVHFTSRGQGPTFAVSSVVRLTSPTGTVTPLRARVVARRPFRAPRVPNGPSGRLDDEGSWRPGWAYLAVLPHQATRSAVRYRGWRLLGEPERAPRRSGAPPPSGGSSGSRGQSR